MGFDSPSVYITLFTDVPFMGFRYSAISTDVLCLQVPCVIFQACLQVEAGVVAIPRLHLWSVDLYMHAVVVYNAGRRMGWDHASLIWATTWLLVRVQATMRASGVESQVKLESDERKAQHRSRAGRPPKRERDRKRNLISISTATEQASC